ncbi:hypothetical protein KAR91_25760 [Candidatus Pacearchaeota archaeon]|nr:hypothetical protein [Candidatus Pacearchaeota archaeon]
MNNQNSITAYTNPNNQKKFNTQKAQIVRLLIDNPNHSRFYLGLRLGIGDHGIQKRLSDLYNEGIIQVSGSRKHGENTISLYSVVSQLSMFQEKKPTLRQFIKKEYPNVLHEFNARYNFEL